MGVGKQYERRAATLAKQRGLVIIDRNVSCKMGELDLVCLDPDRDRVVFVEVRFRGHRGYGSAAASVTRAKQARLLRTAQWYLQRRPDLARRACRFDVVAFSSGTGSETGSGSTPGHGVGNAPQNVQWIENAFTM